MSLTAKETFVDQQAVPVVPCKAKVKGGQRCGAPATHDVLLPCGPCGYAEVRQLCTRHARIARRKWWYCNICRTPILHTVIGRA